MNRSYMTDISLVIIGISLALHILDCDRKHLTRSEFDKHLASGHSCNCGRQKKILRAVRGDIMSSAVDGNNASAVLLGSSDFDNRHQTSAYIGNTNALHRLVESKLPFVDSSCDANANTGLLSACLTNVADNGIDEMQKWNRGTQSGDRDR